MRPSGRALGKHDRRDALLAAQRHGQWVPSVVDPSRPAPPRPPRRLPWRGVDTIDEPQVTL